MKELIIMSEVGASALAGVKFAPSSLVSLEQDKNVVDGIAGMLIAGASAWALLQKEMHGGLEYALALSFGYGLGAGIKGILGFAGISLK